MLDLAFGLSLLLVNKFRKYKWKTEFDTDLILL